MLISIIIPVYNGSGVIGNCLTTVMDGIKNIDAEAEVIVVDDGSTDNTPEIISGYPVIYHRITKAGVASARNAGISLARGDILLFFDADVLLRKDTIVRFISHFRKNPDVSVIQGRWDENVSSVFFSAHFLLLKYQHNFSRIKWTERRSPAANLETGCLGVRREVFQNIGLFNTGYSRAGGEEHELGIRILRKYPIYYYDDIFVEHRFGSMLRTLPKIYFRTINFAMLMFNYGSRDIINLHTPSVPADDKFSVIILFISFFAIPAGLVFSDAGSLIALICFFAYFFSAAGFITYCLEKRGFLFAFKSIFAHVMIMLPRMAGLMVAVLNYYLLGRRDYRI